MQRLALAILTAAFLLSALLFAPNEGPAQNPLPKSRVEIALAGEFRTISSNGIPDHPPGQFPNRHNPNSIREQQHRFRVPAQPKESRTPTPFGLGKFGIAINGVPFDPGAAEFWNRDPNSGWQYEAMSGAVDLGLDKNHAHVQPNGAYHYHGIPVELVARLSKGEKVPVLIGYAADGFPIYGPLGYADPKDTATAVRPLKSSYRVRKGNRPNGPRGRYDGSFVQDYEFVAGAGDLDECNGRVSVTAEHPDGVYCYHLTEEFPFIPRKFQGTPDESFMRRPPGGGPPGFGPPPGRRPPPGGRPGPPRPSKSR